MKLNKLLVPSLLILSACGRTTVVTPRSADADPLTLSASAQVLPPEMDALACPSDMQLIPAVAGKAAFCMDINAQVAMGHQAAATSCLAVGKTLCTGAQYFQGSANLAAVNYWAADMSQTGAGTAQSYRFNINGTSSGFLSSGSYVSLCCSR